MVIPIVMIFLSLALKAKVNRWTNMILGIFYTVVILYTMLMTDGDGFIIMFFSVVEVGFTALIVWYAWELV
jgi:hypothetical protein